MLRRALQVAGHLYSRQPHMHRTVIQPLKENANGSRKEASEGSRTAASG